MTPPQLPVLNGEPEPAEGQVLSPGRRAFLRTAAAGAAMAALSSCGSGVEEFFRKHFKELSRDELARVLARIERRNQERFGKSTTVRADGPLPGVEFGYGLDLSRCVGCRRCVYACVKENNQSRQHPQIHWIQVLEMEKEHGVDLSHADLYYEADAVPRPGKFYFPVQCQQCRNPPCVKTCPTGATWKEPDGIVVIDYDWCIGCRCCMSACPYGARHFNWATPDLPAAELNPEQHYLGNRPAAQGRGGEVHLLHPAHPARPLPGLRRGLPGGRAQVRQPPRSGERDPQGDGDEAGLRLQGGARHAAAVLLLLCDLRRPCPA